MKQAFEEALKLKVTVPKQHAVMVPWELHIGPKKFTLGPRAASVVLRSATGILMKGKHCGGCSNCCEVVEIIAEGQTLAC